MQQQAACRTCLPGPGKPGAKFCVIKKERGANVAQKRWYREKQGLFVLFTGTERPFCFTFFRRREMPWRKTES
ncbi:hypothetical protein B4096_3299 [Heyndrickxia coagulans]|nr:hypothetical protein B4096_3299 [Heyndrickxia coagulans]